MRRRRHRLPRGGRLACLSVEKEDLSEFKPGEYWEAVQNFQKFIGNEVSAGTVDMRRDPTTWIGVYCVISRSESSRMKRL
jgi:hypothetical protein